MIINIPIQISYIYYPLPTDNYDDTQEYVGLSDINCPVATLCKGSRNILTDLKWKWFAKNKNNTIYITNLCNVIFIHLIHKHKLLTLQNLAGREEIFHGREICHFCKFCQTRRQGADWKCRLQSLSSNKLIHSFMDI